MIQSLTSNIILPARLTISRAGNYIAFITRLKLICLNPCELGG